MRFEALLISYATRYFAWLNAFLMMCSWMLLYPLALGEGFRFIELFKGAFFSDIRLTGIFLGMIIMFQIIGFFGSQNSSKFLEVLDDIILFELFNGKIFKLEYSEISSLEYTRDAYKNFEFTFKDGSKKVFYASVKNKQKAFELIKKKIEEVKNKK